MKEGRRDGCDARTTALGISTLDRRSLVQDGKSYQELPEVDRAAVILVEHVEEVLDIVPAAASRRNGRRTEGMERCK